MLTRLNTTVEKRIVRGGIATSVAKKRCRIYGRKAVLCYGFYGPLPYRKPYRTRAVRGPDGTGTVPYIRYPYPPYVRVRWASLFMPKLGKIPAEMTMIRYLRTFSWVSIASTWLSLMRENVWSILERSEYICDTEVHQLL